MSIDSPQLDTVFDQDTSKPLTEERIEFLIDHWVGKTSVRAWTLLVGNAFIIVAFILTAYGWKKDTDALIIRLAEKTSIIAPLTARVEVLEQWKAAHMQQDLQFGEAIKTQNATLSIVLNQQTQLLEGMAGIKADVQNMKDTRR